MGDSLTALAIDGSNWTDRGYAAFLRRFMGSQIDLPASNVFATGGDTTAQILSTWVVPCVVAQPDWCIVEAGINDLLATTPAIPPATTIAHLKAIYTVLISAGICVIAIPVRSTGTPHALSSAQMQQQGYVNNWIKNFCAITRGITYVDVNPPFIDFSSGEAQPMYVTDGIHDTPQGAIVTAQAIQTFLHTIVPGRDNRFTLIGDTFDTVNNPTGNLTPNGLMSGTAGNLIRGATGVTPDIWFGDANDGTVVFSKSTYPGYLNLSKVTMTLSGSWTALQTPNLSNSTMVNFAAGDTLVGEIEADWNIASGIRSIGLALFFQNEGTLITSVRDGFDSGLGQWPSGTGSAVFRTEPFVVPANTTIVLLNAFVFPGDSTATSAEVNWSRASLRKIL
jgi:lysophospholipase L1-like esterase